MNEEPCYLRFLTDYIEAMWLQGYVRMFERWQLEVGNSVKDGKEQIEYVLKDAIRQIEADKESYPIEEIREEMYGGWFRR